MNVFVPVELPPELKYMIQAVLDPVGGQLITNPYISWIESVMAVQSEAKAVDPKHQEFIMQQLAIADVAIILGALNAEQYAIAHHLKWIHVPFSGVNQLLANTALRDSSVIVTNNAGVMAPSMAAQVMGYIIGFARSLPQSWQLQQAHRWGERGILRLKDLRGQTVGIIGYGRIGKEIAKRAKAFEMRVVATKRNIEGAYPELDQVWSERDLDQLLAIADYVVIAAPLTPQTNGLIGREQIARMKPDAYLINIARGPLIKTNELIDALQHNQIAGAALDVFDTEPLPIDSPLWTLNNVILTPHSSGDFDNYLAATIELFCENLYRYLDSRPLANMVNKQLGY